MTRRATVPPERPGIKSVDAVADLAFDAESALSGEALVTALSPDFDRVRLLEDGSVAGLIDLLFTRAIVLGVSRWAYRRRFCFDDRERAAAEFEKLVSEQDVPTGWIARRG